MAEKVTTIEDPNFEWRVPAFYTDPYFNLRVYKNAPAMYEALKQIAKGEGRFSRDILTHAENTIQDMKELAITVLAKIEGK